MPDRRRHPADPAAPRPAFLRNSEAFMTTPVDTVRRFYDALGRGDVPSVLSLLDAQVEWTEAERFPYYGGTWRGPQAVLDNLLKPRSARRDAWPGASRSRCSARLAGRVARSPAQM